MIWRELWPFVLAVAFRRQRSREWVNRHTAKVGPSDDVHDERFRPHYRGISRTCLCPRCVEEAFGHFDDWVRVR